MVSPSLLLSGTCGVLVRGYTVAISLTVMYTVIQISFLCVLTLLYIHRKTKMILGGFPSGTNRGLKGHGAHFVRTKVD